jgi:calcineurin-like phosphoesterase family protein
MGSIVVPYAAVQQAFAEDPTAVHETVDRAANDAAGGNSEERARLIAEWHDALAAMEDADQGPAVLSAPRSDLASRVQTLLASRALEAGKVQTVVPSATVVLDTSETTAEETVQVKFDNNDLIGWLGAGLKILFKPKKNPFLPPPDVPESIPDDARIAMFSDWGTGLYGAPIIRDTIKKLPRCDIVLHLGDTYYSGGDDEIKDRLIGDWPARPNAINRTLNGNHEMYSGGKGYFEALQSFFKQSSSCFAMQNANWLILGLDTSYTDFDLDAAQVAWVKRMVAAAGTRQVILCSHHQLFSALDDQGPKLQVAMSELLEKQRITAWFWGHEHRLVVYEPHHRWGVKGRCVGHGGFPSFRDTDIGAGGNVYKWIHMQSRPHAPEALLLDGPNFWVTEKPGLYSPHGYLFLELAGKKAWETYRSPDNVGVSERWQL